MYSINKKLKAVSLIEMIVCIALISIVILAATNLLVASKKLHSKVEDINKNGLEIDYAVDYILNEIDSSDYISNIKNYKNMKDWLGLVFISENEDSIKEKFSFTTYIFSDGAIYRINYKSDNIRDSIYFEDFQGKNLLVGEIAEFSSEINNDLLSFNILTKNGKKVEICHKIRGKRIG